jgi:hypothetical protein
MLAHKSRETETNVFVLLVIYFLAREHQIFSEHFCKTSGKDSILPRHPQKYVF